jgi:phosphate-selective porin OprO/OprP
MHSSHRSAAPLLLALVGVALGSATAHAAAPEPTTPETPRAETPAQPDARGEPDVIDVPWSGAGGDATADTAVGPTTAVAPEVAGSTAPVDTAAAAAPEPTVPLAGKPAEEGYRKPKGEAERMAERKLGEHITYKPGKGITFATTDQHYALTIGLGLESLYTFTDRRPAPAAEKGSINSFEIRRARLFLSGNVFTPHIKYYTQLQFSPRDLGLVDGQIRQSPVFMSWVAFDRVRDFVPQIGFFFIPYSRQRVQPVLKLQFPDFSLASSEFGLERDVGIDLGSKDLGGLGKLRYHVGAYMGDGTDFGKPNDFGFTYVGRFEVQPMGDFDDYVDGDHARRRSPKLSIGVGYAYANKDHRNKPINGVAPSDGGTTDSHNATADIMFKVAGVSILGDVWFREGRRRFGSATVTAEDGTISPAAREKARSGVGWTGQAGWLLPRLPLEVAARYSGVRGIGTTSLVDTDEIGPGLSYYFAEHALKLQLDYANGWAHPVGSDRTRTDRVRLQLTLAF